MSSSRFIKLTRLLASPLQNGCHIQRRVFHQSVHFRSKPSAAAPLCKAATHVRDDPLMVELQWEGSHESVRYPGVWLRDNCQCPECFHRTIQARYVLMRHLDPDIRPKEVKIDADSQELRVTWPDGHVSPYPMSWLWERRPMETGSSDHQKGFWERPQKLWGAELQAKIPTDSIRNVLSDDRALYRWICAIEDTGLFLLTDTAEGDLPSLAERVAFLRKTNYGETFTVKTKSDPSNLSFTSATLGLHTDLPYYNYVPGVQMLQCVKQTETEGGESEFTDGFHVAEVMRQTDPESFRLLTTLPVQFYDVGEDFYTFYKLQRKPTISLSNSGEVVRINYNNQTRDTFSAVPLNQIQPLYKAMRKFDDLLYHPSNIVRVKMRDGDLVTFHNYRVLHGRTGYTMATGGERTLLGGFLDWDEMRSRRRVLQQKLGVNSELD